MPRKNSVCSLQTLCFKSIEDNFDNTAVKNHLQCLPISLIDELYTYLQLIPKKYRKRLEPDVFLNSYTRQLYTIESFAFPPYKIIAKISQICTNLTVLDLSKIKKVSVKRLVTLFKNLPQIETIKFRRNSWLTNQVMIEISKHCSKLNHLDISECEKITDEGIISLRNKKIEYLNAIFTSVTPKGCVAALKILPSLMELRFEAILQKLTENKLFIQLEKEFKSNGTTFPLKTTEWFLSTGDDIRIATKMFPYLRQMRICFVRFTNEIMTRIRNLTNLELYTCENVDLGLISTYCPRLQCLTLGNCLLSAGWTNEIEVSFNCLRTLTLKGLNISESFLLKLLIDSHQLEDLVINVCRSFNDNLICDVMVAGGFQNLVTLWLANCNSITQKSLDYIMQLGNLKNFGAHWCNNIPASEWSRLQSLVFHQNLNLKLVYDYC